MTQPGFLAAATFIFAAVAFPQLVVAQSTVPPISLGEPAKTFTSVTAPFNFQAAASGARSSMCCTAIGSNLDAAFGDVVRLGGGATPTVTTAFRGDYLPFVPSISGTVGFADRARVCLINDSGPLLNFRVEVSSQTPGTTFSELAIRCEDTSLVGGYNTVVTEFNFLEIVNSSSFPLTARLFAFRETTGGNQVIDLPIALPGGSQGRRVDVDLHSLVGQGTFGSLVLAHDGPKGSVKADVAQYRITSLIPFDFALVERSPLTTR